MPASNDSTAKGGKAVDLYKERNTDTTSSVKEKIHNLGVFMNAHPICMVATQDAEASELTSRCMGLAATEAAGVNLIFHTNTTSTKTHHLLKDPRVVVSFLDVKVGQWVSVSGVAHLVTDREQVRKYYSPTLKPWFGDVGDGVHDGGPEDPRIGLLVVRATSCAYALAHEGMLGKEASNFDGDTKEMPRIHALATLSKKEIDEWRSANGTSL